MRMGGGGRGHLMCEWVGTSTLCVCLHQEQQHECKHMLVSVLSIKCRTLLPDSGHNVHASIETVSMNHGAVPLQLETIADTT